MTENYTPNKNISSPGKPPLYKKAMPYLIGCIGAFILMSIVTTFIIGIVLHFTSDSFSTDFFDSGDANIGLIRIGGVITAGKSSVGLWGNDSVSGSETIIKYLEAAKNDKNIKGVILRIDSPGGSPSGSEEIYNAMMRFRKSGKKIYTSMGDVAASGGYYIACASDVIYADSSTLTGSIGVIWSSADLSDLYGKIGYKPQTLKSGKFKDMGSFDRPMTDIEKKLMQQLIDETYNTFLNAVAKGRSIPIDKLRLVADGRILTGLQAKKAGLVDQIGGLYETKCAIAKATEIPQDNIKIHEYTSGGLWETIFNTKNTGISKKMILNWLLNDIRNDIFMIDGEYEQR